MKIESTQEDLYMQAVKLYHVHFDGLGGDIADVTLTREAYGDLGRPGAIRVTVEGVFEDEEE